ncbi:hypothetical protein G6F55_014180 [Rhizopus delemar]|nr:hypothetical protein G6F55_014180 [Rhizopus delemar]
MAQVNGKVGPRPTWDDGTPDVRRITASRRHAAAPAPGPTPDPRRNRFGSGHVPGQALRRRRIGVRAVCVPHRSALDPAATGAETAGRATAAAAARR